MVKLLGQKIRSKLYVLNLNFRESIEEGVLKSRDEIWITSKLASVWMNPAKIMSAVQVGNASNAKQRQIPHSSLVCAGTVVSISNIE